MKLLQYNTELQKTWDLAIQHSRNGTFLFMRDFMDYHQSRFKDCSLMFFNKKSQCIGTFPAHIEYDSSRISSHGGLTYGGLILNHPSTLTETKEMLKGAAEHFLKMGASKLIYKAIPYIYHKYPSQEDLYWLFRAQATTVSQTASQVIALENPIPFSELRKRKLRKAQKLQLTFREAGKEDLPNYWEILTRTLQLRHQKKPVHTLEEIDLLYNKFPDNIRLYVTESADKQIIAGTIVFECSPTLHVQYIAANEIGFDCNALDFLFCNLIERTDRGIFKYFDFGISTEEQGYKLNEGLVFQKEGFGGRTICYETFEVELAKLASL